MTTPGHLDGKQARKLLDEVVRLVSRHFFARETAATVARSARRRTTSSEAQSRLSVDREIDAILGELASSHSVRLTRGQVAYYEALAIYAQVPPLKRRLRSLFPPDGVVAYDGIGLRTASIDSRTFADAVYDGGPAHRAGIARGDEILGVDGAAFGEISSFDGKTGTSVRVDVRPARDAPVEERRVRPERILPADLFAAATRESVALVEHAGRRIGYLHAWSYAGDRYHRQIEAELSVGRLKSADALVLDLRGGWGGASPCHAELFVGATPILTFLDRGGTEHVASFRWRRPVVALIDGGTRSGKEVLAFTLQRCGVRLVGERSAGAVLGARAFLLGDGSLLLIASHDVRVDGERLEGRGVKPDIAVPFELAYARGRDPIRSAGVSAAAEACRWT